MGKAKEADRQRTSLPGAPISLNSILQVRAAIRFPAH